MKVVLTSKSKLKREVLEKVLKDNNILFDEIVCTVVNNPNIPNQPVNSALTCAKLRTSSVNHELSDLVVSIENGIVNEDCCYDICAVHLTYKGHNVACEGKIRFNVPIKYFRQAKEMSNDFNELGFSVTMGELIAKDYSVPKDNWMSHSYFGDYDRSDQIYNALNSVFLLDNIQLHLNIVRDDKFKPGIVFKDMSRILANKSLKLELRNLLIQKLSENDYVNNITKIVGLDSRGYIYGMMIADEIHTGFVMARKCGKTPCTFKSQSYGTEYSQDTIEIMNGLIEPGDKVLIVDDLVATGGSLIAARKLVEAFEGEVVAGLVVLQVDPLIEQARKDFGKPLIVALP